MIHSIVFAVLGCNAVLFCKNLTKYQDRYKVLKLRQILTKQQCITTQQNKDNSSTVVKALIHSTSNCTVISKARQGLHINPLALKLNACSDVQETGI